MEIGELITIYRNQISMTIDELVEKSGVPKGTINKMIGGQTKAPTIDNVKAIAKALGRTLADFDDAPLVSTPLFTSEEEKVIKKYRGLDDHGRKVVNFVLTEEHNRAVAEKEKPMPKVKIYDLIEYLAPVSAGHGVILDGSGEYFHYNVVANRYTEKADYTVRVQGQSMEPRFYDGDRLLVEEVPDVDFGEVGIFVVNGQGYVKLKGETSLLSINPFYPGVTIDEYTDFRCVGRVVGTLDPSWVVE